MNRTRMIAVALILIGASSYGLLSPFIKFAYDAGFADGEVSVAQVTGGTALLWLLLAVTRSAWSNPFRGPWIRLALIGIFGLAATTVMYNVTLSQMDASLAIVFLFQFTWITTAMESIASRRWPNRYQLLGIAVIMAGTLCAVDVFAVDIGRLGWKGALFGFLSAVSYSLFIFCTGRVKTTMHPLLKSVVMMTAALPFVYVLYPPAVFFQADGGELLLWGLLLGTLGQTVPTVTFNVAIPRIGSALAALLGSMELPVAVVGAFLIIGEHVGAVQWLGVALILFGIAVSERLGGAKREASE
ncbi:MAG: DMT family transporter [Paenibacillaceae bacterium]|nr:DMT family transporter [Paenibacillaceae bacterium]